MKSNIKYALFGSLVILIVFSFFVDFSKEELLMNPLVEIGDYEDAQVFGNSTGVLEKSKNEVCFTYTLGEKAPYPYAGIKFNKKPYFDFSSKDVITVFTKVNSKKRLHVFYLVQVNDTLDRIFRYSLLCLPGKESYELDVDHFITPSWWFKNKKVSESELPDADLSKVVSMNIENDIMIPVGTQDKLCFTSIQLRKNNLPVFVGLFICMLLFNGSILLLQVINKKKQVVVSYKAQNVTDFDQGKYLEKESQRVMDYLSDHYDDPELTLNKMRKKLGLSENKIASIVKKESGLLYKNYLHSIRISEAKRLLKMSNRNINEVAVLVGYGNISTFNRAFKKLENQTASEFLENL
ncbi:MAG: AraC-like DNA-binding protein [Saprospiraceae bacterium]|jgi:AraC-like DNA-binding protein